ncbi:DUF6020 family protein [Listeria grandensis]|uniref:DUF6020 family protein n=1 Tax=Listeria grandensis TaxID=1494963 RepID=UPI00164DEEDE|nr:DUF6020 family protein [Listeria grandensis]MBC6314088.1 glycosyltransferase family 39 protein [Listeria grandensis]
MLNRKRILSAVVLLISSILLLNYYLASFKIPIVWLIFVILLGILFIRNAKKTQIVWSRLVVSGFIGCFWMVSSYNGGPYGGNMFLDTIIVVGTFYSISAFIFLLIEELNTGYKVAKKTTKMSWFAIYTAVPLLIWTLCLLAYYPAKMTFDSYFQWAMAHGVRHYNEWHPMLHTLWIEATTAIYNSPSSYIFSQILVSSLIVGYAIYTLAKWGMPRWLGVLISVGYAVYPVAMIYSATMWKDIPFASFVLLFITLLLQVLKSDGAWLRNWWHVLILVIVAFITINLRNNGIIIVIASLLLLIIFMKNYRIKLSIVFIMVIGLNFVFSLFLSNVLQAQKSPLNQALAIPSQQIAATFKNNGQFTPELKDYFTSILPEENWKKDYNPYTVDPIKHDVAYDSTVIEEDFGLYIKNWFKLLTHNFRIYVNAYLDHVAVIWQFYSPEGYKVYFDTPGAIQDMPYDIRVFARSFGKNLTEAEINKKGYEVYKEEYIRATGEQAVSFDEYEKRIEKSSKPLISISKASKIKEFTDWIYVKTTTDWQNYLLKGAIPVVLILIAFVSTFYQRNKKMLLLFVPAILVVMTIAIAMPATDFRYCYSFVFATPILLFATKLNGIDNKD